MGVRMCADMHSCISGIVWSTRMTEMSVKRSHLDSPSKRSRMTDNLISDCSTSHGYGYGYKLCVMQSAPIEFMCILHHPCVCLCVCLCVVGVGVYERQLIRLCLHENFQPGLNVCTMKTIGGCYMKTIGGCYMKTIGGCYMKTIGGCYMKTIGGCYMKTIGGCYMKTIGGCYMKTVDPGLLVCHRKSTSGVMYGHLNAFTQNLPVQCCSNLTRDTHRSMVQCSTISRFQPRSIVMRHVNGPANLCSWRVETPGLKRLM